LRVYLIDSIYILSGNEKHFARKCEWVRIERCASWTWKYSISTRYYLLLFSYRRKVLHQGNSWSPLDTSECVIDNLYVPGAIKVQKTVTRDMHCW